MQKLVATLAISIAAVAGMTSATPALAADPVAYSSPPPRSATVYQSGAYQTCQDVEIEYRSPYPPRREIVRMCEAR